MNKAIIIAKKEFRDNLRNRWIMAASIVFAIFALTISYFGFSPGGTVGFSEIEATIASLTTLAIYLIPLVALLLGHASFAGEEERGSLHILLSLPISRLEIVLGKFFGLSMVLAVSTAGGFGIVGIIITYIRGISGFSAFFSFIFTSILLGMAFLGMALLLSASTSDKSKVIAGCIVLWFIFVMVYDLALLGVLIATGGGIPTSIFNALLFLNPTDVYRLINLLGMEAGREFLGLTGIPVTISRATAALALIAWVAVPVSLAYAVFKRRDY
jgi:Cu-processing system permease protein